MSKTQRVSAWKIMKYSFYKGLMKLAEVGVFVLPFVIQVTPDNVKNMTIGSVLFLSVNFLRTLVQK